MKQQNPLKRLIIPVTFLVFLFIVGTLGYMRIEGWPLLDSLYMMVITLATVGYREIYPLNEAGKILTMVIILCGVSTLLYTMGQAIEIIVEGKIVDYRRRKKMDKMISDMRNHYIICGYGRVGRQVAHELLSEKEPFVVIDNKPGTPAELESKGIPYLVGDVTSDEVLEEAGIRVAKVMMACSDSDTANVYVTLSARVLNPSIFIVARAGQKEVEEKIKKAGADRVLSPYFLAGRRMANMAMKPVALDYLDTVMNSEHLSLNLEELKIEHSSKILGKTLEEAQIKKHSGAYILSIRKANGNFVLQPTAETVIEKDDILVAIGTPQQFNLLEKMVR